MGRRAIMGAYGREIPQEEHGIPDSLLLSGEAYATHRGVSRQRVAENFRQRLIDRLLDSKGRPCYSTDYTDLQWKTQSDPARVSTPTRGQASRGMKGQDAMEIAGSFTPTPVAREAMPRSGELPTEEDPGELQGAPPLPGKPDRPAPPPGGGDDLQNRQGVVYGQARTKGMIHKAQLDELKVLQARGLLVNRAALASRVQAAAETTRDRLLAIPDFMADDLIGSVQEGGPPGELRQRVITRLRGAIETALTGLADGGIAGDL